MARPNVPEVPVYEAPLTIAWKGLRPGLGRLWLRFQPVDATHALRSMENA